MRSGFKGFGKFNVPLAALAAAFMGSDAPAFAGKLGRSDIYNPRYEPKVGSRYMPHQGMQECERRRRQMAKAAAKKEAKSG